MAKKHTGKSSMSVALREMQIGTAVRYQSAGARTAGPRREGSRQSVWAWGELARGLPAGYGEQLLEAARQIPEKLDVYLPPLLALPRLGARPGEIKTCVATEARTRGFLTAAFTAAERWTGPRRPAAAERETSCDRAARCGLILGCEKADAPQGRCARAGSQTQEGAHPVTPRLWDGQSGQTCRDREQAGGCQGLGLGVRRDHKWVEGSVDSLKVIEIRLT